jgi:hypothetical protein
MKGGSVVARENIGGCDNDYQDSAVDASNTGSGRLSISHWM